MKFYPKICKEKKLCALSSIVVLCQFTSVGGGDGGSSQFWQCQDLENTHDPETPPKS